MVNIVEYQIGQDGIEIPIYQKDDTKNTKEGRLVICTGSSILAQGLVSTGARFGYDVVGPMEWAAVLSNQRFSMRNAAVSGQTSTEIRNRFYRDVLSHNPDVVVIQNGTNEIGTGVDPIWVNTKAMFEATLRSGAKLIACSIQSRDASAGWTENDRKTALELNEKKRKFCESNANCTYVDLSEYVSDPNSPEGYPLPGMLRDGIHWSAEGAYRAGVVLSKALNEYITPTDVFSESALLADGVNLIYGIENVNPTLLGTGGSIGTGASGTVPNDWRLERNNASGTVAGQTLTPTGLDPTNVYEMTFTPGGNADEEFYFRTASSNTTLNSNEDFYEALMGIEVDAWENWKSIQLECDDQGVGNKTIYCMYNSYGQTLPNQTWKGILRTPKFKSDGAMRFRLRVIINGTGSGTGTIRVYKPQLRRLDSNLLPNVFDSYDWGTDNKIID